MSDSLTWIMTDGNGIKAPKWQRLAAVADDGTVFVPAAIAGNEQMIFLIAGWDGNVPVVSNRKHLYVPARWLAKERPDIADVCLFIESKCHQHLANEVK